MHERPYIILKLRLLTFIYSEFLSQNFLMEKTIECLMSDIEELAKAADVDATCRLGLDQIPVLEHTAQTTVDCKLFCTCV